MTEEDVTDLLYEFRHWESEEEEGNDLLITFRNWVTEEEEKQEYDRIFLREYFPQLPRDVQKCIRIKVVILFRQGVDSSAAIEEEEEGSQLSTPERQSSTSSGNTEDFEQQNEDIFNLNL
ncbi:hypothetical protein GOP47_0004727 [Adiantum capillus-veneris]|uniref:CUT domain-containing protein n=1 Tax=Adiantum capillus-veneris TaxID=13818 RepID=A0A9D4V4T2_ADICA|nr:hypothetical protein GOP47_0004727 [Adiantum capillus-veneris]